MLGVGPAKTRKDARATNESTGELFQVCLAMLSAAAGLIHLATAFSHFGVSALHGAFFIGTGVSQLAAAALLTYRSRRWVLVATASGNAVILAIWVMSRTTGIPVEPHPWTPEPVGIADAVASLLELVLVIGSPLLLSSSRSLQAQSNPREHLRWLVPATSLLVILTGLAIFSAAGGDGHSHPSGALGSTRDHGHAAVHLVHGRAMVGASRAAGPAQLPADLTKPAPVLPPPAAVAENLPPVPSRPEQAHTDDHQGGTTPNHQEPQAHEGGEHQGHE
ncbi:MAG: hypothetical protein WD627_07770 [Actinomycetota bacterium]